MLSNDKLWSEDSEQSVVRLDELPDVPSGSGPHFPNREADQLQARADLRRQTFAMKKPNGSVIKTYKLSRKSILNIVGVLKLVHGNLRKRVLHPFLERLGIPKAWPHAFRHSRVTQLRKAGNATGPAEAVDWPQLAQNRRPVQPHA